MSDRDEWTSQDLPVLDAAARLLKAGQRADKDTIAEQTSLGADDVAASLEALGDAGYLNVNVRNAFGGHRYFAMALGLTERGRRELGIWPSPDTAADRLIAALEQAIRQAPTPEERTRLQQAREALAGIAREVLVGVATGVLTGRLGG